MIDALRRDLFFAARSLRRSRLFTVTSVLTLALGIASALVMSVTSVSFAQRNTNCIPHYDSSGAQTAPYC